MRWVDDPSGRFPARPFYERYELEALGARLAAQAARRRGRCRFRPPLDTDALLVLLEAHVDDLDLFARLTPCFGPGVEAATEFRPGRPPVVRVERRLAADPRRRLRLRFTLAHELGHVLLHRELWDRRFSHPMLFPAGPLRPEAAHSRLGEAGPWPIGARRADWLEWQAGYLAAALLAPAPALAAWGGPAAPPLPGLGCPLVHAEGPIPGDARPFAGTPEGDDLIDRVARAFQLSRDATTVRLRQVGWLRDAAEAGQPALWTP